MSIEKMSARGGSQPEADQPLAGASISGGKKLSNQKGFLSILVLLIATGIIGYFSYKALIQEGDNPNTQGFKDQIEKAEGLVKFAEERARNINEEMGVYIDEQNKALVTLKIDTSKTLDKFNWSIEKGASVFKLMKEVGAQEKFSFKYKDSNIGVFITEINGIKNNAKNNTYWMLYVNGSLSEVGASLYKLSGGDVVEWKYEDASDYH